MTCRAPVSEFAFVMAHVVRMGRVAATRRFAKATPDTVQAILAEAGRALPPESGSCGSGWPAHPSGPQLPYTTTAGDRGASGRGDRRGR